jgi:ribonuclease HI
MAGNGKAQKKVLGQSYAEEAARRFSQGLGISSTDAVFLMREELKQAGWMYFAERTTWCAPTEEERRRVEHLLQEKPASGVTVTAHADAGFKAGRARIGYFLRCAAPPHRITHAEELPEPVKTSQEAEALAILHAIRRALDTWPETRVIFLRNDNQGCIQAICSGNPRSLSLQEALTLLREKNVAVDARHVPGHQKGPLDRAAWCNNRVDELAHLRGR